ncbi:MAG: AMP-binding protein [Afipia sp.]|nr:AMP-binding protein [Afipia sp.]
MSNPTSYVWTPPPELIAESNLTAFLRATGYGDYDSLSIKADSDPAWLMEEVFKFCGVRFYRPYDRMLDLSRGQPWARWCIGGTTNIVLNCIDKHRDTHLWDQTFLVWESEDKLELRNLSYREIDHDIGQLARALTDLGIGKGDVVALYMPNVPETFVAFFRSIEVGRDPNAPFLRLWSGTHANPAQPWRRQSCHHCERDMAARRCGTA